MPKFVHPFTIRLSRS